MRSGSACAALVFSVPRAAPRCASFPVDMRRGTVHRIRPAHLRNSTRLVQDTEKERQYTQVRHDDSAEHRSVMEDSSNTTRGNGELQVSKRHQQN